MPSDWLPSLIYIGIAMSHFPIRSPQYGQQVSESCVVSGLQSVTCTKSCVLVYGSCVLALGFVAALNLIGATLSPRSRVCLVRSQLATALQGRDIAVATWVTTEGHMIVTTCMLACNLMLVLYVWAFR